MPRDGSGNYTLPTSNPIIDGTLIDVNWANPTMSDIATQLNNVYTRDGVLGPLGPFRVQDGSISTPSLSFVNETGMGWYRPSLNILSFATAGNRTASLDSSVAASGKASFWPRAAGPMTLTLYRFPSGNVDLSGLQIVANTATNGTGILSLGATGVIPDLAPLAFGGSSFAWVMPGGLTPAISSTAALTGLLSVAVIGSTKAVGTASTRLSGLTNVGGTNAVALTTAAQDMESLSTAGTISSFLGAVYDQAKLETLFRLVFAVESSMMADGRNMKLY